MPGKLTGRVFLPGRCRRRRRGRQAATGCGSPGRRGGPGSHFRATALPGHATAARLCPACSPTKGRPRLHSAWLHKQPDPVHIAPTGEPVRKACGNTTMAATNSSSEVRSSESKCDSVDMPTDINIIIRANAAAATEHANRIRAQGNSDNSKQSTITDRNNFQVNNRQGGGTSPTNKISRPEFLGGGKIGETLHIPPAQSAPRSNGGTPSIGHVPPKAPLAPVGGVNMGGKTDGDKGKLDTGLNLPSPSTTGEGDSKPAPVVNPQAPVRPKLVPRDGEKVQ